MDPIRARRDFTSPSPRSPLASKPSGMLSRLSALFRLIHAALTLVRHDAVLPLEYQALYPWPARFVGRVLRVFARRAREDNPGERLARALEKLGPSYVKLGQVLATRGDVIGPRFARGLSRLQDRMPAFGMSEAQKILTEEFGAEPEDLFDTLGEPVAAASIAQVHKARLADGRDVAVKIIRPDIELRIARDIESLELGANLAERFFSASRRLEPVKFVETVSRSLRLETDLRLEAASATELAEASRSVEGFCIPDVIWERTSKRVLTTQWIDGIALTDEAGLDQASIDRTALAQLATRAFLGTALDHGVFHADMHAGNLFVDRDERLWAVDFGIMGRIGRDERRFLAQILHGFLTRDYLAAAKAHFAAGYVPKGHSIEDFASALRAVGEPIFGKTADEVPMSRVLLQLLEITEIFDMRLRPELIMLQKTMVQCEGVARMLDDRHDMWQASAPVVETWMKRELGPEGRLRDARLHLERVVEALGRLPGAIDTWAELGDEIRSGGLTLARSGSSGGRWVWVAALIAALAAGASIGWAFL